MRKSLILLLSLVLFAFLFLSCENPMVERIMPGKKDKGKYTVTFIYNDWVTPDKMVNYAHGEKILEPEPAQSKKFHTFNNAWYNPSTGIDWDFANDIITGDITLRAGWTLEVIFDNTADIVEYLTNELGNTVNDPLPLPINIQLTEDNWLAILTAIGNSGKFVDLDLSDCTHSGISTGGGLRSDGAFDPVRDTGTGKNRIVSLVLPEEMLSIVDGDYDNWEASFKHFSILKTVSAQNCTSIGDLVFLDCTSLTSVEFPAVTSISVYAFRDCTSLESVGFPLVTSIGEGAFFRCTSLTSVSFPASAVLVGYPFSLCNSLVQFYLTGIGSLSTLEEGKALVRNETELIAYPAARGSVIMNTITSIGDLAFFECTSLESVEFPAVTSIGAGAFRQCFNLESVEFPLAISIGNFAFVGCYGLESVEFPLATSIGDGAFAGCTSLESVEFPLVTSIGSYAFDFCDNLSSITIAANCAIHSAEIRGNFSVYYDSQGKAAGRYTWVSGSWTGPVNE